MVVVNGTSMLTKNNYYFIIIISAQMLKLVDYVEITVRKRSWSKTCVKVLKPLYVSIGKGSYRKEPYASLQRARKYDG